jgi:1-acyl-sn-glycerol-3-phosphate acyltransferase
MTLYEFFQVVLRPTTAVLYAPKVSGLENVPADGPFVLASNHRSYLDPPLLGTWFPRIVHCMAKEELFAIPMLGPLLRAVNAFPVKRDEGDVASFKRALRVLKGGAVVGIFPEGTRNLSGVITMKSGAVLLAATAGVPIVPVGLVRTDVAARKLRAGHVEIHIGKPMTFQGSARRPTKAEIDAWTKELEREIARLSGQQVAPELSSVEVVPEL